MPHDRQPLIKLPEVTQLLAVSRGTVLTPVRRGELPAIRIARSLRFRRADIVAYVDRHRTGAESAAP